MTGITRRRQTKTLRPNTRLLALESVSALMVLMGMIATIATQKMVLVAAPLSFSVVLNLHNRRQLDRLSYNYAALGLSKIRLSLQQELRAIQPSYLENDQEDNSSDLLQEPESITGLMDKIEHLKAQSAVNTDPEIIQTLQGRMDKLKVQTQFCSQRLAQLQQVQSKDSVSTALAPQLAALKAEIRRCQVAPALTPPPLDALDADLNEFWLKELGALQSQIQPLSTQINQIKPTAQSGSMDRRSVLMDSLQNQLSDLYQQMNVKQAEWKSQRLPRLESQQELQRTFQILDRHLIDLQAETGRLKQLQSMTTLVQPTQVMEEIEAALVPLQLQLVALDNQLDLFEFDTQISEDQTRQFQAFRKQLLVVYKQAKLLIQLG